MVLNIFVGSVARELDLDASLTGLVWTEMLFKGNSNESLMLRSVPMI